MKSILGVFGLNWSCLGNILWIWIFLRNEEFEKQNKENRRYFLRHRMKRCFESNESKIQRKFQLPTDWQTRWQDHWLNHVMCHSCYGRQTSRTFFIELSVAACDSTGRILLLTLISIQYNTCDFDKQSLSLVNRNRQYQQRKNFVAGTANGFDNRSEKVCPSQEFHCGYRSDNPSNHSWIIQLPIVGGWTDLATSTV